MTNVANQMFAKAQSSLKGRLIAPHQHDGVKWMIDREVADGPKGGILADEMGLGKTIQTIATTLANPGGQTLVIVPKTLQLQWIEQIQTFTGMRAQKYHTRDLISDAPYVVATYGQTLSGKLKHRQWFRIVLDEAHTLRNHKTKTTRRVHEIPREITWCLTGTPVVRNRLDAYTLVSLIGDTDALCDDDVRGKYILRRTFEDSSVLCPRLKLPGMRLVTHDVTLSHRERETYNNVITYGQFAVRVAESMALEGSDRREAFNHIFQVILRLQQLVVSPSLCMEAIRDTTSSVFSDALLDHEPDDTECPICMIEMTNPSRTVCGHWFCSTCISTATGINSTCPMCRHPIHQGEVQRTVEEVEDHESTKIQKVLSIVSDSNDKTIIYTHWRREQDILRQALEHTGRRVHVIDGSTPQIVRHRIVSDFNESEDPCILVANIHTTSTGLNLQAAKTVIFPSLDWSPCTELQAIARVHRIGVQHTVTVHRIIAPGTIDDRVQQRQMMKLESASSLLADARIKKQLDIKAMDLSTIKSIFTLI